MPTFAKEKTIGEIVERLESSASVFVVDYRGLSVKKAEELRRSLRETGAELKVYKNNLIRIALEQAGMPSLDDILEGPLAYVFIENDPVAPAKTLKQFAKETKILEIRGGISEKEVVSEAEIKAIAELPSREELLAKLLGTMQNPMSKVVRVLNGPAEKLARTIAAIAEKAA